MYKIKDSIKNFISYKPSNIPYIVKLDANESTQNESILFSKVDVSSLERYPDHFTKELREQIALKKNVKPSEVLVGNGSSELLELIVKTFINPGDKVLSAKPSFVMYEKYTQLSNGVYLTIDVNQDMSLNINKLIKKAIEERPKIIFLCTPNNPTGYLLTKAEVLKVVKEVDAYVVVDEAYMEFTNESESVIDEINNYPNLVINRTFSKAYGLAGLRLGYLIANRNLIETLSIAKTPYSVNTVSQQIGALALKDDTYIKETKIRVATYKKLVDRALGNLGIKTFKSSANFIYCYFNKFALAEELKKRGVLIRDFKNNFYRITIGTKEENEILVSTMEEIFNEKSRNK